MIYSKLIENRQILQYGDRPSRPRALRITVQDKLLLNALLISRQFRLEYEMQARKDQTIIFTDHGGVLEHKVLPEVARRCTKAIFQLAVICAGKCTGCYCEADFATSMRWTKYQLRQLSSLKSVEIDILPCLDLPVSIDWLRHTPGLLDSLNSMVEERFYLQITVFSPSLRS